MKKNLPSLPLRSAVRTLCENRRGSELQSPQPGLSISVGGTSKYLAAHVNFIDLSTFSLAENCFLKGTFT